MGKESRVLRGRRGRGKGQGSCLAEVERPQKVPAAERATWPDGDTQLKGEGLLTLPRPLRRAWGLGPFLCLLGRCDRPGSSVIRWQCFKLESPWGPVPPTPWGPLPPTPSCHCKLLRSHLPVCTHSPYSKIVCCSVAQSCLTPCNPMDCSKPGSPGLHCLQKLAQIHFC